MKEEEEVAILEREVEANIAEVLIPASQSLLDMETNTFHQHFHNLRICSFHHPSSNLEREVEANIAEVWIPESARSSHSPFLMWKQTSSTKNFIILVCPFVSPPLIQYLRGSWMENSIADFLILHLAPFLLIDVSLIWLKLHNPKA